MKTSENALMFQEEQRSHDDWFYMSCSGEYLPTTIPVDELIMPQLAPWFRILKL